MATVWCKCKKKTYSTRRRRRRRKRRKMITTQWMKSLPISKSFEHRVHLGLGSCRCKMTMMRSEWRFPNTSCSYAIVTRPTRSRV